MEKEKRIAIRISNLMADEIDDIVKMMSAKNPYTLIKNRSSFIRHLIVKEIKKWKGLKK